MDRQGLDLTKLQEFLHDHDVKPIDNVALGVFKERFKEFFDTIQKAKNNTGIKEKFIEEAIRELMANDIKKYKGNFDTSQENNYDIAIRNNNGDVITLLECKKVSADEMSTLDSLNKKSLQQLIYYFFKENVNKISKNLERSTTLKTVMISDGFSWLIWKASDFYPLVTESFCWSNNKNEKLVNVYTEFDKSNDNYHAIEAYIKEENKNRQAKFRDKCYAFDLHDLASLDALEQEQWEILYRFFSGAVWLGRSAQHDPNSLNPKFYHELLHIMGLKEIQKKEMLFIVPEPKAIHSFYDQVRERWATNVEANESLHEGIFQNIIPWINRMLFLKLLEAHIMSARANPNQSEQPANFDFMTYGKVIKEWSMVHTLFFNVLAVEEKNRERVPEDFRHIPYLNSSLFTYNADLEQIKISELSSLDKMTLYKDSVLKSEGFTELGLLEYFLRFLGKYAFNTDGKSNVTKQEDNLINASVLGKVFEKLNGYKEGSFYTPSFITTYICKESIHQALVGRVNETIEEADFKSYGDLLLGYRMDMNKRAKDGVREIIRSLTILDPAVGSGHFLVSALNVMMEIRYAFDMFEEPDKRVDFTLEIVNDELLIRDRKSLDILRYNVYNAPTQAMQETLFKAKQEIIENNLFGVDINPNSVEICRLRLWIELLKTSHYIMRKDEQVEKLTLLKKCSMEHVPMATLPNIDINVKTGNSLLYSLPLDDKIDDLLRNELLNHLKAYANAVQEYKHVRTKVDRNRVEANIASSKNKIELALMFSGKDGELGTEWRYLFPESIDLTTAKFQGFDVVVGNPPYGIALNAQERKYYSKFYNINLTDTAALFMLLMKRLLKEHGRGGFIIPKAFTYASNWEKTRDVILPNLTHLYDCGKVWGVVKLEMVVYLYDNINTPSTYFSGFLGEEISIFLDDPIKKADTENFEILLNNIKPIELALAFKIKNGRKVLNDFVTNKQGAPLQKHTTQHEDKFKVLGGKELERYAIKDSIKGYMSQEIVDQDASFILQPNAILVQRIVAHITKPYPQLKIMATSTNLLYNLENYVIVNTIIQLINNSNINSFYFIGLLNSTLVNWYVYNFIVGRAIRTIQFYNPVTSRIPVVEPTPEQEAHVVSLVDKIIQAKQAGKNSSPLEQALDDYIFILYGLTEEEIALVKAVANSAKP